MKKIIFINPNLDKCKLITKDKIILDSLEKLINEINEFSQLTFVLSKQTGFSGFLELPNKNKSLFKKNAEKIVKQDHNLSSADLIYFNKEHEDNLPYFIISKALVESVANIFKKYNLQNYKLYFETSLINSDKAQWSFLIKDNEEINIYFNGSIFTSRTSNLSDDINVLFSQNDQPRSLHFYSLDDQQLDNQEIQNLKLQDSINITYFSIFDNHLLFDEAKSTTVKSLLKRSHSQKKELFSNWKSLNLIIISLLFFLTALNHNQASSDYTEKLKARSQNLIEYVFQDEVMPYTINDLEAVSLSIENSSNLPSVNHINTLNYIGRIFGIPGIDIDQLTIQNDNSIFIKLNSNNKTSIPRINESLQSNEFFISEVRSIQNLPDNKISMEIMLTLKDLN
tara:strand:+ start:403 stop:1590 length:1188 start_codon:yes stop_codon:yes gene_type:complete